VEESERKPRREPTTQGDSMARTEAKSLSSNAVTFKAVAVEDRRVGAEARVGDLLGGRWRLEKLLGMGGAASVYAARHRNGNRVAIKVLHAHLCHCEDVCQRFLAEAYAANRVGHPGVAAIRDEGIAEDGSIFLVMELLEGETLEARRWRETRLEPRHALQIADRLLDALAQAHERGVIHRDIKPDNIFLTRDGRVVLLDFGVAHLAEPYGSAVTQSGAPLGTPAFMPPEQASGYIDRIDARTDLWAVGATLFTVLSGRFVHQAETVNQELCLAMIDPAPSLGKVVRLPAAVVKLVDRALAFDPEQRFPDACSMQAAVRSALASLPASVEDGQSPERSLSLSTETPEVEVTVEHVSEPAQALFLLGRSPASQRRPRRFGGAMAVLDAGAVALLLSFSNVDRAVDALRRHVEPARASLATSLNAGRTPPTVSPVAAAPRQSMEDADVAKKASALGADEASDRESDPGGSDTGGNDTDGDSGVARAIGRAAPTISTQTSTAAARNYRARSTQETDRALAAWRAQVAAFKRAETDTLKSSTLSSLPRRGPIPYAEQIELSEDASAIAAPDVASRGSHDPLRRRK
jgi:serine/threonine-protein kinase